MKIQVTEKIDFNKLAKKQVDFTPAEMFDIGAAARSALIQRIDKGQDVNNRKMRGYSEEYKKVRAKKGKTTEVVNLEFSNKMKASIQPVDPKVNEVYLEVQVHQTPAYWTNEDRNWWGLDKQSMKVANEQKNRVLARKVR